MRNQKTRERKDMKGTSHNCEIPSSYVQDIVFPKMLTFKEILYFVLK